MTPECGGRELKYAGDSMEFRLLVPAGEARFQGGRAFLRTSIGRAARLRHETIETFSGSTPGRGGFWRDVPMRPTADGWAVRLALTEVGYFESKAYLTDAEGRQHWPEGPNHGVSVHPDTARTANTIYCAFTRLFGASRTQTSTRNEALQSSMETLDRAGFTVIPQSGTLRDLKLQLPHIFERLGCRYLHLLPVNPTPTTFARFGRFGSPYACRELTDVDPALAEFDHHTTAIDQFVELADAVHGHGGRLLLDMVINHTGWNSVLQERHPEWFVREPGGRFVSPGAWGTVWEDLIELDPSHHELWVELAEAFLTWCRRGVDGFRCDAGYKVPAPVWRYIIARVREQFPNTLFLLEGLGGGWMDTETLLTTGGMQWAYSELFQEYSGVQVAGYLEHSLKQSHRVGTLVHYSETHDNLRLAARGRAWSLLRNRLSALASVSGGFGFTCGVEWLAAEKINVHQCTGLSWDAADNIVAELAELNRFVANHPTFFDGARLQRLSTADSPVYALRRDSACGTFRVLVLANLDMERARSVRLPVTEVLGSDGSERALQSALPVQGEWSQHLVGGDVEFTLEAGLAICLQPASTVPAAENGERYRCLRAVACAALEALASVLEPEAFGTYDPATLAGFVSEDVEGFLGSLRLLTPSDTEGGLVEALRNARSLAAYRTVIVWDVDDARRITFVPLNHWLLIQHSAAFEVCWTSDVTPHSSRFKRSVQIGESHCVCIAPDALSGLVRLQLRCLDGRGKPPVDALLRCAAPGSLLAPKSKTPVVGDIVLLANQRGGMARIPADFSSIQSKYDCFLGANLHPTVPVDRHVFVKRVRLWAMVNGFLSALDAANLAELIPGTSPSWIFEPHAGDGRSVRIRVGASMVPGENTTLLSIRHEAPANSGPSADVVVVTVRFDIEDRSFHSQTRRNSGAEHHFESHTRKLLGRVGFEFTPAPDRRLTVLTDGGSYHEAPEWSEGIPHPVEQRRGQEGSGDAWSPGWFELPLSAGEQAICAATSESTAPSILEAPVSEPASGSAGRGLKPDLDFRSDLVRALDAYLVRRGDGCTVIAGYPWFLDWGRDTLIAARGLIAAGRVVEVLDLLRVFGRFVQDGTLPNSIHGEDASNRDTSDASLWYGIVCEELACALAAGSDPESEWEATAPFSTVVDSQGRTVRDVLREIARGYMAGTPNGIKMDAASGLIWSPAHFTWMDTNYPAGTPREGYPVEIQALWIRLLRQLDRLGVDPVERPWKQLAELAERSVSVFFWMEDRGYFADCLVAKSTQPARSSPPDDALRPNCLFLVSLGLIRGERARRTVAAAARHLVVPGAIRSLAPLSVAFPLAIRTPDGRVLNDPNAPYWGRYEGDEDTRRKPAYHNGTAWVWPFPTFCEAVAVAYERESTAVNAALSYLESCRGLMNSGCLGQLPEVMDGDTPHAQRGCDAQAWSASEVLRVWKLLGSPSKD